jgi:hypothetical protein
MRRFTLAVLLLAATVASEAQAAPTSEVTLPKTEGERYSGFSYVPMDPMSVKAAAFTSCKIPSGQTASLMDALPDNAVRMAVQDISGEASASLGPVVIGGKGRTYRVVIDYVSGDTANVRFQIADISQNQAKAALTPEALKAASKLSILRMNPLDQVRDGYSEINVPVYVGVGLRLTAMVKVKEAGVNLASLGGLAAAVQAKKAAGSLVVQTLGVNGPAVAATLPLPSELNVNTVQNAILALGSIKSTLYDPKTRLAARVTGIYNPLESGDVRLINGIVSELGRSPIEWTPCQTQVTS